MVHYANIEAKENVLLNRIEIATSEEEYLILEKLTSPNQYVFTLLPTRMVCVQVQEVVEKCVGYDKQTKGRGISKHLLRFALPRRSLNLLTKL